MDYPYGEERWSGGTLPTDYRFTDQKLYGDLGIYHMGARWFDSYLSRWLSADSIVPDPKDPQSLNRYSWVLGNPLRFIDPSGFCAGYPGSGDDDACWDAVAKAVSKLGVGFGFLGEWDLGELLDLLTWLGRGFEFQGGWTSEGMRTSLEGLQGILGALDGDWDTMEAILGMSGGGTFSLERGSGCDSPNAGACAKVGGLRTVFVSTPELVVFLHETGHHVDHYLAALLGVDGFWWSESGLSGSGWTRANVGGYLGDRHWYSDLLKDAPYSRMNPVEDFADTFTAYVLTDTGSRLPPGWRPMSDRRRNALAVALEESVR